MHYHPFCNYVTMSGNESILARRKSIYHYEIVLYEYNTQERERETTILVHLKQKAVKRTLESY